MSVVDQTRPSAPDDAGRPTPDPSEISRAYVRARLEALETIIAGVLATGDQRRVADPLRGVRITVEDLRAELVRPSPDAARTRALGDDFTRRVAATLDAAPPPAQPRLHRLARRTGLDDVDVSLLVIAAAPDLDRRFERFYGFLNDDVSLRRSTVGLALELAGLARDDPHARARLQPTGRLARLGLIDLPVSDRPTLTRPIVVPERVVEHLLGGGRLDPELERALRPRQAEPASAPPSLVRALRAGVRLTYCHEAIGADGLADACDAVTAVGGWPLPLDVGAFGSDVVRRIVREAALTGCVPVVRLQPGVPREVMRTSIGDLLALPWPIVLIGPGGWDPQWSDALPAKHEAVRSSWSARQQVWSSSLSLVDHDVADVAAATGALRFTAHQVRQVTAAAAQAARLEGRPVCARDLREEARGQNNAALERVAVRLHPRASWADLVLRADQLERLREVEVRARNADLVLNQWGMGTGSRRRGIIALFAGPPGTGKTMAAEVLGDTLGLDLYVINLATVIDKYIGETEKNLERVFEAATGVNGILFFDEADALFGKRSEVKDARDRYANVETAYLLQRLERFEGTAILATNLKANLDDAFARRIDVYVDFPMPEADERRRIWRAALSRSLPTSDDIDVEFLARSFELGGGNIVNVVVTAAFIAAERGDRVTMADLIRATGREYRKLGRLCTKEEFGPHLRFAEAG